MSYYDFLCSLAERLSEKKDEHNLDSAIMSNIRLGFIWFEAGKAARYNA